MSNKVEEIFDKLRAELKALFERKPPMDGTHTEALAHINDAQAATVEHVQSVSTVAPGRTVHDGVTGKPIDDPAAPPASATAVGAMGAGGEPPKV